MTQVKDKRFFAPVSTKDNSITFTRSFDDENYKSRTIETSTVDALIDRLIQIPQMKACEYFDKKFVPISVGTLVKITDDIFGELTAIARNNNGKITELKLVISSPNLSCAELVRWAADIQAKYVDAMFNDLGEKQFIFRQAFKSQPSILDSSVKPERRLAFVKSPFFSNKTFDCLYGSQMDKIRKRLTHFLKNRDWYDDRGIPYQLGIMLSGKQGCGKTSVIRAMANMTGHHLIIVNFANIQTATQLRNMFFSEFVDVFTDEDLSSKKLIKVPLDKRIYVLEELDAVSDIVRDRRFNAKSFLQPTTKFDDVTLGEILGVLDGTIEIPGRIVVITTNYPEYLDKALIRAGRIDVAVHFDGVQTDTIYCLFEKFFDRKIPVLWADRVSKCLLSPAQVSNVFFRHFGETDDNTILEDLVTETDEQTLAIEFPLEIIEAEKAQRHAEEIAIVKARQKNCAGAS